ncbi:diacylglycerol/lipid kinase family protein [Natronoglomus mannanivorans]|uniref:YegS/Rv2252/BmrU family lipid kinase n=1 Tax=Natronoglomus mannanivorans TaxID=2979990 RepID=A0AAP2YY01_9EURY|nr:YegS/Rv2252/BmrU family lipid kinase [Halobacteria archaeon AArc-xg1-1]
MVRTDGGERRVLVLNPTSGSEDHVDRVVELAGDHGFDVRTTDHEGHAQEIVSEAGMEADLVAAAGGDGTVNEVVNGLVAADRLEETTLGVVPTGTGNNFASNVGIDGLEHAFEVMATGERRAIDVGLTNERTFVNSCVSGITAEASGATSSSSKGQFGVLAYVMSTIDTVADFDPIPLCVEMGGDGDEEDDRWEGEAMFVLVGNCRRFTTARRAQANVEDGRFEVTIVEHAPTADLVGEAALKRVLGRRSNAETASETGAESGPANASSDHIVQRRTPSLSVTHRDGDPVEYSLDGEMLTADRLTMRTRQRVLTVAVGEGYRPDPDRDSGADRERSRLTRSKATTESDSDSTTSGQNH